MQSIQWHAALFFLTLFFFSQDILISRYQSKVADSKLTVKLKYAKKICDEAFKALTGNEALEGVAKGRHVLSLLTDVLYKRFIEGSKALTGNEQDSFEINANALEGVAKGRHALSLVADFLYKWFIEGDRRYAKDLDVKREAGCLLGSARKLCMEGSSTTPQLYLLQQLVRRYGFDCVRTMGGYKELEWMARKQVSNLATLNSRRIDSRIL